MKHGWFFTDSLNENLSNRNLIIYKIPNEFLLIIIRIKWKYLNIISASSSYLIRDINSHLMNWYIFDFCCFSNCVNSCVKRTLTIFHWYHDSRPHKHESTLQWWWDAHRHKHTHTQTQTHSIIWRYATNFKCLHTLKLVTKDDFYAIDS